MNRVGGSRILETGAILYFKWLCVFEVVEEKVVFRNLTFPSSSLHQRISSLLVTLNKLLAYRKTIMMILFARVNMFPLSPTVERGFSPDWSKHVSCGESWISYFSTFYQLHPITNTAWYMIKRKDERQRLNVLFMRKYQQLSIFLGFHFFLSLHH